MNERQRDDLNAKVAIDGARSARYEYGFRITSGPHEGAEAWQEAYGRSLGTWINVSGRYGIQSISVEPEVWLLRVRIIDALKAAGVEGVLLRRTVVEVVANVEEIPEQGAPDAMP